MKHALPLQVTVKAADKSWIMDVEVQWEFNGTREQALENFRQHIETRPKETKFMIEGKEVTISRD